MLTTLIALSIFGTILIFLHGCEAVHRIMKPRAKDRAVERIQKWSTIVPAVQLEILRKDALSDIPWLNELLLTMRRFQPLRILHRRADSPVPLGVFVLGMPILALIGFIIAFSMRWPIVLGLLFSVILGTLPVGYLHWLKKKRMTMFERQLPEALELISRSLRAGHALSVGLKLVGEELRDPVRTEFKRVFDEVSMGVALPQALQNMTERLDSIDVGFFVTSVLVQRETGGNLAEIIDSLAGLIRQRFELQLRVRALSAEGRFSAVLLVALPIVVSGALYKLNPDYISTLFTDPMGHNMVVVGSVLMVVGSLMMKRMVAIKV